MDHVFIIRLAGITGLPTAQPPNRRRSSTPRRLPRRAYHHRDMQALLGCRGCGTGEYNMRYIYFNKTPKIPSAIRQTDFKKMELSDMQSALSGERFLQLAWGVDNINFDSNSLAHYIAYVDKEIKAVCLEERIHANIDEWAKLISLLKTNPIVSRAELCQDLEHHGLVFPESVLHLMIRITFAIASLPDNAIGGQLFRPQWKAEESISTLVSRVFPQRLPNDSPPDTQRVKMQKMSFSYVAQYTHIEIHWTDYLSDHLLLSTGINWKRLYVFRHPAFIRAALQSLETKDAVADTQAISQ